MTQSGWLPWSQLGLDEPVPFRNVVMLMDVSGMNHTTDFSGGCCARPLANTLRSEAVGCNRSFTLSLTGKRQSGPGKKPLNQPVSTQLCGKRSVRSGVSQTLVQSIGRPKLKKGGSPSCTHISSIPPVPSLANAFVWLALSINSEISASVPACHATFATFEIVETNGNGCLLWRGAKCSSTKRRCMLRPI